ncbi:hypothetical protein GCM10027599_25040 [Yimella radicis]
MPVRQGVIAIVPAKDEAARIEATVQAVLSLPEVLSVIVVDDGSGDGTHQLAADAGAYVSRHPRTLGKATAMDSGVVYAEQLGYGRSPVLFVDADLEDSAHEITPLIRPILAEEADMTIATLPAQKTSGGGTGRVVRLARDGIQEATGRRFEQPLSGQRCLNREALDEALPFATGWGVEVGMTIDVLRAGLRVQEVPVALHHRVTGTDLGAQLHRANQFKDVWIALRQRRAKR